MLDINRIRELLPHRYPMLMVDRVLELTETTAAGIKNVTANEPFFNGHFPEYPVMPGVLIAEALAQMGAVLVMSQLPNPEEKLILFASIDQCKFRRQVIPGDQLRLEVEFLVKKASVCKMAGKAFVDGKLVAEGVMMCQIVDKPKGR
ncbi:MAG: 3-hydroxyacyl-ACP dehydratase FabZ [Bryobacterales bacterium]|nr:3-hydroxyacyl-ACP dehydratase FabZ [Acidobacteriota bacterium]MCB9384472.1 3-hydroxyacyl-ACP dehydratase FabZ [Bryobacterales bacterium]